MKKFTSALSTLLVLGAMFQNAPVWAQAPVFESSEEVKTETIVEQSYEVEKNDDLSQCCPPPYDSYCPSPCPPRCEPYSPPCDPCCPPPCTPSYEPCCPPPCPSRCEPCPPSCNPCDPSCPPPCPPPCDPPCPPPCPQQCPPPENCPPPCDPCAPVCKRSSGISIWAIGIALLAVGGAAAIVATSNNGATGSSE
jgi:hypothetical protein